MKMFAQAAAAAATLLLVPSAFAGVEAADPCKSESVESTSEGETDAAGLTNFTAATGSEVSLVTGDLASAYFQPYGTSPWARVGVRLTSSVPAKVEDQKRYVDHELQLKDGGILNFSFSLFTTASIPQAKTNACQYGGRNLKVDRHYFGTNYRGTQWYLQDGFGVRAIKRADGSDAKEKTSAAGYAYVGFGFDTYLMDPKSAKADGAGLLDLSLRLTYNRLNSDFAKPLYEDREISNVVSGSVALKFNISGTVAATIEYSTPFAGAKAYGMSEIALLSVSYAPKKQATVKDDEGKSTDDTVPVTFN